MYNTVGAGMEVYNTLGRGMEEPIYQEALEIELSNCGLAPQREVGLILITKGIN